MLRAVARQCAVTGSRGSEWWLMIQKSSLSRADTSNICVRAKTIYCGAVSLARLWIGKVSLWLMHRMLEIFVGEAPE